MTDLGLSPTQLANARGIIAAIQSDTRFAANPKKAAIIAIETALTESGMRMIASANVPESQKYPYEALTWEPDGLGHDHASMGMFQQQTGYRWTPAGYGSNMNQTTMNSPDGWGTPAELMDSQKSTTKFLNALANVDWLHLDNWVAAQAVQRSAFSDGSNYQKADATAQNIVATLWQDPTPHPIHNKEIEMFMIQNDKSRGGNGGIALVMANGAKVIHDVADVANYQKAGIPGPIPVANVEFNSYPRVGN